MQEYYLEQKRNRVKEDVLYYFSHGLSWFSNVVADFLVKFLKAIFDAFKYLLHM